MEGNNKIAVYAVVALLLGVAVGAGAGYVMFKDKSSDNGEETYWFFVDYQDDDAKDGWVHAKAKDLQTALGKIFKVEYSGDYLSKLDGKDFSMSGTYIFNGLKTDSTFKNVWTASNVTIKSLTGAHIVYINQVGWVENPETHEWTENIPTHTKWFKTGPLA